MRKPKRTIYKTPLCHPSLREALMTNASRIVMARLDAGAPHYAVQSQNAKGRQLPLS